ncbi:Transposon Ty2-DR3 Gag-Pol polyprotein [Wickerhamomyces ciferrii]|uniref:Transposon Ty2-DR3 Gag-Pol polyprotein n=1 Tax=Wickerhamomyces ciferrii (strain ATCC 14091 / BCRC 22168 / CBS 111 / JCM 3599 / NBRC 0793 / NRRL Y-1031 F-60-10) TaxID=1206466 RepID=K0KYB3_WICCF|nr:Transposon Ty2-DR3 Gag-Pol polyprotein [Wickerhamomyces ciferrii]CCH46088.1 Transposon Ty2-DR3 Gag-Pol polyprotein [Wickerhamomyces ciferrii]
MDASGLTRSQMSAISKQYQNDLYQDPLYLRHRAKETEGPLTTSSRVADTLFKIIGNYKDVDKSSITKIDQFINQGIYNNLMYNGFDASLTAADEDNDEAQKGSTPGRFENITINQLLKRIFSEQEELVNQTKTSKENLKLLLLKINATSIRSGENTLKRIQELRLKKEELISVENYINHMNNFKSLATLVSESNKSATIIIRDSEIKKFYMKSLNSSDDYKQFLYMNGIHGIIKKVNLDELQEEILNLIIDAAKLGSLKTNVTVQNEVNYAGNRFSSKSDGPRVIDNRIGTENNSKKRKYNTSGHYNDDDGNKRCPMEGHYNHKIKDCRNLQWLFRPNKSEDENKSTRYYFNCSLITNFTATANNILKVPLTILVDSGANCHVLFNGKQTLDEYEVIEKDVEEIFMANGQKTYVHGRGKLRLFLKNQEIVLENVLNIETKLNYIEKEQKLLLSATALAKINVFLDMRKKSMVNQSGEILQELDEIDGLVVLDSSVLKQGKNHSSTTSSQNHKRRKLHHVNDKEQNSEVENQVSHRKLDNLHIKCGHFSKGMLKSLYENNQLIGITELDKQEFEKQLQIAGDCTICQQNRFKNKPASQGRATRHYKLYEPGEFYACDHIIVPKNLIVPLGFSALLVIKDVLSGLVHIEVQKTRSNTGDLVKKFIKKSDRQNLNRVKVWQTDNALEFRSMNLESEIGVIQRFSTNYRSTNNSSVERENGLVMENSRTIFHLIPKEVKRLKHFKYAIFHAVALRNIVKSKTIKIDLTELFPFGSLMITNSNQKALHKINIRGDLAVNLGANDLSTSGNIGLNLLIVRTGEIISTTNYKVVRDQSQGLLELKRIVSENSSNWNQTSDNMENSDTLQEEFNEFLLLQYQTSNEDQIKFTTSRDDSTNTESQLQTQENTSGENLHYQNYGETTVQSLALNDLGENTPEKDNDYGRNSSTNQDNIDNSTEEANDGIATENLRDQRNEIEETLNEPIPEDATVPAKQIDVTNCTNEGVNTGLEGQDSIEHHNNENTNTEHVVQMNPLIGEVSEQQSITNINENSLTEAETFTGVHNPDTNETPSIEAETTTDNHNEADSSQKIAIPDYLREHYNDSVREIEVDENATIKQRLRSRANQTLFINMAKFEEEAISKLDSTSDQNEGEIANTIQTENTDDIPVGQQDISFKEAIRDIRWKKTVQAETSELKGKNVMTLLKNKAEAQKLVKKLKSNRILPTRWVHTKKLSNQLKSRLVVKGYCEPTNQQQEDLFSPTLTIGIIRLLLNLAVYKNKYQLATIDYKQAFLNGILPAGQEKIITYQDENDETQFAILHKSLYGLKISPLIWNLLITKKIIQELGFECHQICPTVFIKKGIDGDIESVIGLFVDDAIILSTPSKMKHVVNEVLSLFEGSVTSNPEDKTLVLLGSNIHKEMNPDFTIKEIKMSKEKYISNHIETVLKDKESFLNKFSNTRLAENPIQQDFTKPNENSVLEVNQMSSHTFERRVHQLQILMGKANYLAQTRGDIRAATTLLSSWITIVPSNEIFFQVYRLYNYIVRTKDLCIVFKQNTYENNGTKNVINLNVFSDASHNNLQRSRSLCGYTIYFNKCGIIDFKSQATTNICVSTCESELTSIFFAYQRAVYYKKVITRLFDMEVQINLHTDAQSAINYLTTENVSRDMLQVHSDLEKLKEVILYKQNPRFQLLKELVTQEEKENVHIYKVPGYRNVADILTKSVTATVFRNLLPYILGEYPDEDKFITSLGTNDKNQKIVANMAQVTRLHSEN